MAVNSQNRMITVVSAQPTSSKWWWNGAIRNTRRPVVRKARTCTTTEVTSATNSAPSTTARTSVRLVMDRSLTEAMAADVVVVAVPGGPANHHLINAEQLAAMKPGAILVNIARGDVVDEAALVETLQQGRIGGAGLDVYEHEPRIHPALLQMENVTLLPHLGTAALEVRTAMGLMAVDNLIAHAEGRPLPNPV